MKQKQPSEADIEKTVVVSSRRKSADADNFSLPGWRANAADRPSDIFARDEAAKTVAMTTAMDRTQFIGNEPEQGRPEPSPTPLEENSDGKLRPDPAPRLQWPARDQHMRGQTRPAVDEDITRPARQENVMAEDDRTRLYRPTSATPAAGEASASTGTELGHSDDPVVGWLVIIEGAGKGRSLEIGIGANAIGRERGQKLRIDFGDQHISREKHAVLVFDPRSRRFFLQGGDVRNLTYIGDDLVLAPTELIGGETIVIGQTHLRFVPLCGPQFNWS